MHERLVRFVLPCCQLTQFCKEARINANRDELLRTARRWSPHAACANQFFIR